MIRPKNAEPNQAAKNTEFGDEVWPILKSFASVPLLSIEQELKLGTLIQIAHKRYRLALLSDQAIAGRCVELLREIVAGKLRLDRALELSLSDMAGKAGALRLVKTNLPTVEHLLRDCSSRAGQNTTHVPVRKVAILLHETRLATKLIEGISDQAQSSNRRRIELTRERFHRLRNRMVEANLRLAIPAAKKFSWSKVSFSDLILEGTGGLIRAAEKFDPARGIRFSTYGTWWIQQRILIAIKNQNFISVSDATRKQVASCLEEAGSSASYNKDGPENECVDGLVLFDRRLDINRKKRGDLVKAKRALTDIVSLDLQIDEGGTSLGRILESSDNSNCESAVVKNDQSEIISKALAKLPAKERSVIRMRFGVRESHSHSLAEAAARLKLSRERIRQLEKQALERLRNAFGNYALTDLV